jgi:hypothetical protein
MIIKNENSKTIFNHRYYVTVSMKIRITIFVLKKKAIKSKFSNKKECYI